MVLGGGSVIMEPVRITEGAEAFTANAYLVAGETTALVDVGTPSWVADAVSERVDALDAILVTHAHHDHIDQLESLVDRFDPTVYAHGEVGVAAESIEDGEELPLGDTTVTVMHTPGHASDHVVFFDDRWLFSGDVVVYNDGAFDDGSFGRTDLPGADREVLIESITRLADTLPGSVESMYPGHGDPYTGEVHAVIQRSLERASRREPKYPE